MRTNGDVRVLYELRPMVMKTKPLCFAQFATDFRILKPALETHRPLAYEKTVGEIDPATGVGPDSSESIAGSFTEAAPRSLKLANGKIMVKRCSKAVPHLLYSGALNKYSSTLLFSPWKELESIRVDQEDIETAAQRQTRLELFPKSVFPVCNTESDGDEIK